MTSSLLKSASALAVLSALVSIPVAADASGHAKALDHVYLVQGVPGAPVDITIDGRAVKSAVAAKAVVGPLALTPGKHTVTFAAEGWTVSSTVTISKPSSDIVLHWPADAAKKPVVTLFANDLAPVGNGKGRLTVAHTAVVPPADIRVNDKVLFANIANGEFVTAEVPGGTYSVEVVPTGQKTNPLLGPVKLPVTSGALTRVFAIGQPSHGSMDAVVQTLPLATVGSRPPGHVEAGSAGLVATSTSKSDGGPNLAMPALGFGMLALAGALAGLARRRRAAR